MCRCALNAVCGLFRASKTSDEDSPRHDCFRWKVGLSAIVVAIAWFAVQTYGLPGYLEILKPFAESFLEALFVAAVLAFSVDLYLKKQIARDAFEASIGYILPKYLQDEIRAIYSNEIICLEHAQNVKVETLDSPTLVRVTVRTQRKLKNISTNWHHMSLKLDVDEWFEDTPSTIGSCGYRVDGGKDQNFDQPSKNSAPVPKLVAKASASVDLKPNSEIEVWQTFTEIKRRCDLQYLAFSYATNRPRVYVTVPEGFDFAVEFTHRLVAEKTSTDDTTLPGLLLPNQCIIVRWWEKEKLSRWKSVGAS